jgi:precorrin-6x reductase
VANDAQHKFFRSGVPTVAYSDPHIHSIAASLLKAGDCVVAISQRGGNAALLRSIQLARKGGADIIVLARPAPRWPNWPPCWCPSTCPSTSTPIPPSRRAWRTWW